MLLLHLKSPRILRKSAAARVARQGVPAHVSNYGIDPDFNSIWLKNRSKQQGLGERGAPEISSQKLADFECRFPYDSYGTDSLRAPF